MEGNNKEEKEGRLADLSRQYAKTGEELVKLATELGYGTDEGEYVKEFAGILAPAGFCVYQADKLEGGTNDSYILKVVRTTPKYCNEGISN